MNEALVRATMSHIRAYPEFWDQSGFVGYSPECGTTHCFAGWALRLSGFGLLGGDFTAPEGLDVPERLYQSDARHRVSADFTAQWLLDFTDKQVAAVFYAFQGLSLEEFARKVERVTGLSDL